MHSSIVRGFVSLALFSTVACSDDGDAGQSGDGSSGNAESTGDGGNSASASASSTQTATLTDGGTDGGGVTSDDGPVDSSGGFISPESGDETAGPGPQPNGGMCESNEGCDSGFCYLLPMIGGVCSECLMDADCEMGTCALSVEMMYAVCTMGELGDMCDSDEGCMGELVCTQLIDTGGFFNASYCSTCGETLPCEGTDVCTPVYDAMGFSGHMECAGVGSVPNGGGCPLDDQGVGDGTVCMSGVCSSADAFMGFVQLGVCGDCNSDDDCTMPATCTPAMVGMGGLTGSVCE
ncbi:MAG TPA: hypothetical protein VFG69_00960 [Nannocystaceae bacterium]|nr:hypothetical protein [Nannocystaceae bacterium]